MERTCPLGHVCDSCLWQIEIQKQNIQTGEVKVEMNCAIVEACHTQVRTFQQVHSVGAALEGVRNAAIAARQEARIEQR